ncbi:MAG: penicillin acylase family protein [Anaerolineae bacterium]|nr:penicillin acylase family protein [Anaerolineae bacterium]
MRKPIRLLLVPLALVLLIGLVGLGYGVLKVRRCWPRVDGTVEVDGLQEEVTVVRDDWGIPHIYASNTHDLFFAQGYVHAQDRFWQMEFWRRIGSGRLSEVLGESALEQDRFIRTVGWHRAAQRDVEHMDERALKALEDYAEGVNAYVATHQSRLGLEFTVLGLTGTSFEIEPWTPFNSVSWGKVMAWDLSGNRKAELLRAQIADQLGRPAVADLMPPYSDDYPIIVPDPPSTASLRAVPDVALEILALGEGEHLGSNNWAIAGERTESGMPLLANDPHLGIQMPSIWYEIGLHCEPIGPDCPYNVVGASFASTPGVIIGHNDKIAWGMTNLGPDVQDLFIEQVNPENPNQYAYQGEWRDMEIVREEIRVAGQENPVVVDVRLTHHGPIINDVAGGTEEAWSYGWQPLALSWTALQPGTLVESILLLDQAGDWTAFREALSYWDAPSQNFVYADVEGNIGYQAPGRIPIRAAGDGTSPVPGWTGEYEWVDTIPFEALPRSFNPAKGYIVTANNAVVGPDYPYLITKDWAPGYRAYRIDEMITSEDALSVADMRAIQADHTQVWAREVLPYVTSLTADEPQLAMAIDLLRAWDGHATRDSAGAALFEAFRLCLIDATVADELGEDLLEEARPAVVDALLNLLADDTSAWFDDITTPATETRDDTLLKALREAVEDLTELQGSRMERWQWGDLHTASFENQSLGQSGIRPVESLFNRGPFPVDGTLATVNQGDYSLSDPYTVRTIASYRQIIDLGDLTRSVSMHTTGQSGHPFHRHYDDMIASWRDVEHHPMLWDRQDVEAGAEGVLVLTP